MQINHGIVSLVLLALSMYACAHDRTRINEDGAVLFIQEVLPIIQSKCLSCHGEDPDKIEGGLDLRTRGSFLQGGKDHKQLVVSGRPEFSPLYQAVSRSNPDRAMPPREREALSADEVQSIYHWIVRGGDWPSQEEIQRLTPQLSVSDQRHRFEDLPGESSSWNARSYRLSDLWAYLPLEKPIPPDDHDHPVDAFVQEKLQQAGLQQTPPAPRNVLARRAAFDLLGMPLDTMVQASYMRSGDFLELIEHLLGQKHYGEKMATHWLDVVRYADSDGFSNDYARPNAWRYRDYVIRSFNQDKPYDQFVLEQLAGDEMDPTVPENLIATGFLRMGPWEHTGMSVAAETRQYFLDDITNSVGETFLATPLNCARCHDHKYDPIPTHDYYQIQAVFATTQFAQRMVPFQDWENLDGMEEGRHRIKKWLDRIEEEEAAMVEKEETAVRQWFASRGHKYLPKRQRRALPDHLQPPRYHGLTLEELGYRKLLDKRQQIENRKMEQFLPQAFSSYSGPTRVTHSARSMPLPKSLDGSPQATFVLSGGSVYARGERVAPGVLQVVHHLDSSTTFSHELDSSMFGRRLAFAQWLVHSENPITARVMANRIWKWHFGEGLAANENNFGATGDKPSHPELLDWLACELMENNWSVKHLHRIIMTSRTYQMADQMSKPSNDHADPDNRLLSHWNPRRLSAEEIRDAMLLLSGELNPQVGGIPIRPEIPLEVALQPRHTMGSVAPAYQPSRLPSQRNRRSIYIDRKRSIANPMMQTFNQAGSELSCEDRENSTVVNQAFDLLNSRHTRVRSLVLADQITRENYNPANQIVAAYRRVLKRRPLASELNTSTTYLAEMKQYHDRHESTPFRLPAWVDREMHEEMTGLAFSFEEYLDIHDDYVYDLDEGNVSATNRAVADLIAVLFNTNEFLYVY